MPGSTTGEPTFSIVATAEAVGQTRELVYRHTARRYAGARSNDFLDGLTKEG